MMKKLITLVLLGIFAFSLIPINANARVNARMPGFDAVSIRDFPHIAKNAENYSKVKSDAQDLAKDWVNAKRDFNSVKEDLNSAERLSEQDRDKVLETYKKFLSLTIDRIITRLQMLSHWVDRVIEDEDKKEELFKIIDEDIAKFEDFKKQVQEAKTREELKDLSKKIKEQWKETRFHIKKIVVDILSVRLENMIERFDKVSQKLHERIDNLDQANSLVVRMQELLDQFDEKIKLAKEEYNLYREAITSPAGNAAENVDEAREHLRNIHKYLKEAREILKEIIDLYRQYNAPSVDTNETDNTSDNETNRSTGPGRKPLYLDIEQT